MATEVTQGSSCSETAADHACDCEHETKTRDAPDIANSRQYFRRPIRLYVYPSVRLSHLVPHCLVWSGLSVQSREPLQIMCGVLVVEGTQA